VDYNRGILEFTLALTIKNRRAARVLALQALYELDSTSHSIEQVMIERLQENQIEDDLRIFAYKLINGVRDNHVRIDRVIQQYAPEWPLDQVALIDRNLLRIAVYEFAILGETPTKVAINEAVDLAKEFGSESASRFVNGVLGALVADEAQMRITLEDGINT
jgi:N utilization substance protein B